MKQKVIVIGGGASGMTAAIFAARAGASVTILEHGQRLGKKILSTGNGRCNLTNLHMETECFRSDDAKFPAKALEQFGVHETLDFFRGLGLMTKDKNGYVYPRAEQAAAVLDLLLMEVERLGIRVVTECEPEEIHVGKGEGRFQVTAGNETFSGSRLIIAAGSKAAPVTGSDGSGYELAKGLGHRVISPLPALVQLRCKENYFKKLAGIRTEGRVTLKVAGKATAFDTGEIQLTDYGISGIPVFQVSRFAAVGLNRGEAVEAVLDLCPELSFTEVMEELDQRKRRMPKRSCEELLNGWFHKKMIPVLLSQAGIHGNLSADSLDGGRLKALASQIKGWRMKVTAVNPFTNAQVCCGGVDTRQIDPMTMESRLVRGLYFAGEILDVDGICGGYNLQWAWTSGALSGMHAGGMR